MKGCSVIYHFTDESSKRPVVYKKQLEALNTYSQMIGYNVENTYVDKSIKRTERVEFDKLLKCCDHYDAIIVKDFYHISLNTGMCMKLLQFFKSNHAKVFSIENGEFTWNEAPFEKKLKVATYCCRLDILKDPQKTIQLQNDILRLFIEKKTSWSLIAQYYDTSCQKNGEQQVQLSELINHKNDYDLLLVHNLENFHYRTARMCKYREQLQLGIYSLQEGYLEYKKDIDLIN